MVVFTCNHCGESLKKNTVEKHKGYCRKPIFVSCMDCFKDFNQESFAAHIQCITELERYSGKDYVAKASLNKGQRKQEAWVDLVRNIQATKTNISQGVQSILTTISSFDNIPRKKAKFLNFMKNSFRYMKQNDLEQAWTLLEEGMNENKTQQAKIKQKDEETPAVETNGDNKKRKIDEVEDVAPPAKKKKKSASEPIPEPEEPEEPATEEKFKWGDAINAIMMAKNELKLTKLKKKVLKKYQSFYGLTAISDKIENKFNKKIAKLSGVVVENDKVRLIAC